MGRLDMVLCINCVIHKIKVQPLSHIHIHIRYKLKQNWHVADHNKIRQTMSYNINLKTNHKQREKQFP